MSIGFSSPLFCLLVVLFTVDIFIVLVYELILTMDQTSSKPKASLNLVLARFQDVMDAAAVSTSYVRLEQLGVFCSPGWPASWLGWPPEGSFDIELILRV